MLHTHAVGICIEADNFLTGLGFVNIFVVVRYTPTMYVYGFVRVTYLSATKKCMYIIIPIHVWVYVHCIYMHFLLLICYSNKTIHIHCRCSTVQYM